MSYYYTYYIGYLDDEKKIHPLGPYDNTGKLHRIISRSRSFASDLHEDFIHISKDMVSDDFMDEFSYSDYDENGNEVKKIDLNYYKYLPINELGSGDYIKTGYYLIEDANRYRKEGYDFFGGMFYDHIVPEVYLAMVENELKFGKPGIKTDEFGRKYTPHSAADYMYFVYPDYYCREYEVSVIKNMAEVLDQYDQIKSLVVILSEG